MSFLILALPRSRTYWLSNYLSYPPHQCGHDVILECNSLKEYIDKLNSVTGSIEQLGSAWPAILRLLPGTKIVVVRRPVQEIYQSLIKVGIAIPLEELYRLDDQLEQCSYHPGVKSISFYDLNEPAYCKWLFEYCLDCKWDQDWYTRLATQNLQIDISRQMFINRLRYPVVQSILQEAETTLKEEHVS